MRKILLSLILFCTLFFFLEIHQVRGQQQREYTIQIKDQKLSPAPNAETWFHNTSLRRQGPAMEQVILQFTSLPDENVRRQLAASGISLLNYLPNNAYTALVNLTLAHKVSPGLLSIRSVIPFEPQWKLDDRTAKLISQHPDRRVKVTVSFVRDYATQGDIELLLQGFGGKITDKRFAPVNVFEVALPANRLMQIAANPLVKYVSIPASDVPLNDDAAASSGAMLLQSPSFSGQPLDGSGVTIGVGDNTTGIVHVDVRDRLINFNPDPISMHGVHTTLTVAGKGIMDPRTTGMAPSSRVLAHLYNLVWANTPAMFQDYNMTLTNNSYAAVVGDTAYSGTYDLESQMLDQYALQYPLVQNVFASGNDGLMQKLPYPASFHTVNGGYQAAKNIITVGALAKDNTVWPKSSRGPVKDGRLKPEIVGYGFGIFSGDIFDNYGNSNGTSMSCPVVTGCLGLLEQRYKQLFANANAPTDVLKALILNGATDHGNPGPDYTHGYGLVNVYRSALMLNGNQFLRDSVNHGAIKNHTITVPPNTAQLKIMLYWHDEPASPSSPDALVNNLDLQVNEPNATNHKPLILDPSATAVNNNAFEGIDSRNNSEQVVINNPLAGTYAITVNGTFIPSGQQAYVIAYDAIPVGVKLKYPIAGVPVPGNDSVYIYWDASDASGTFTLQYSDNGGSGWNNIATGIPSSQRHFFWHTPNISTSQAKVRILRNSTVQDEVGLFTINAQPVVQLSPVQCPGYMAIQWNAIPNATGYEVLKKIGDDLQPIDTVTALTYVISGLAHDTMYYMGVRPLINNSAGFRSKSVKRTPIDGSCSGTISDGDLMLKAIVKPSSGRKLTNTELTSGDSLIVSVFNLDDVPAGSYRVSYSLNAGPWQSQVVSTAISAQGTALVSFTGLNLSAVGTYQFMVAVENLSVNDPVRGNDSLAKTIRHLTNDPVDLNVGFLDDFEGATGFHVMKDSMGVISDRWDYYSSSDTGRLSSFISSDVLIDGNRSISMDQLFNTTLHLNMPANLNFLTGTFNLQAYDTATTEARVEFDYKIHGQPKHEDSNKVWVRGNDSQPWLLLYNIDTSATPGQKVNTGSLSATNLLRANGQQFSPSFQVRIGQHDTSVIAMNEYGNGLTIDNFRLYSVKNDVQLLSVVSPVKMGCGLTDSVSLGVLVYNSDNLLQDTIIMNYRINNGPVVKDTLFSIGAKDTVLYTFTAALLNLGVGYHTLDIWLINSGDTYLPNDSIMNYRFRNQPLITSFPYLETFEGGDGHWFTEGVNSSWEHGAPASVKMTQAASGTQAWATSLSGNHNNSEESYLYSPCFDISALESPMLSFSLSTDIENCGTDLCDAAYIEYSLDESAWTRLEAGSGINWYGDLGVWNESDNTRWRVASASLPDSGGTIKLRFVFSSDPGTARDGIAIDDMHIFDLQYPVYDGQSTVFTTTGSGTGSNWIDFTNSNKLLAQVNTANQNIGTIDLALYNHSFVLNPITRDYHLGTSFAVHAADDPADSVQIRLYITEADVLELLQAEGCTTCTKAEDAYRLGITKYDDADKSKENGSLSDNNGGTYSFIPHERILWVPYHLGYYAQTTLRSFSELWFNTGIPSRTNPGAAIYPNPVTNGKINLVWSTTPGSELQLMVTDALGRVVYNTSVTAVDYDNHTTFELPDLSSGVYVVKYITEGATGETKIMVLK